MDSASLLKTLAFVQGQPSAVKAFSSILVVVVAVAIIVLLWRQPSLAPANVSFERVTIFAVTIDADVHQMGIIIKLFNKDPSARMLTSVVFEPLLFQTSGGNGVIQKFFITAGSVTNDDDLVIKPNDYREFKFLLPIKWVAHLQKPQDFIFLSPFTLHFRDGVDSIKDVKAERYGNLDRWVSMDEWSRLLRPTSTTSLDQITYKRTPAISDPRAPTSELIVFNPDRTANIDVYGFDQPGYRRTSQGVVTLLIGNGDPVLDGGWLLMARGYDDLLRDSRMVTLYNSIVGVNADGHLQRLDAGFRAADRTTMGPFGSPDLPVMCDWTGEPPYCHVLKEGAGDRGSR
jgi:hypothetical protein